MDKKNLAVFVPTYCRGPVIKELLENQIAIYTAYGVDFYICDSSEDDETKEITELYKKSFDNLYYIRFPSELHGNMKVYKIYQRVGWVKDYDYVWMFGDAVRFTEIIVAKVIDIINTAHYDMLVTYLHSDDHSEPELTDINQFFVDYAWKLNLFGACVLNTRTMLSNVDWKYLEEKYTVTDKINYSHTCYYFEQIAKLNSFTAKEIHTNINSVEISSLRKYTGWHEHTFLLSLDYCVSAMNALPDVYKDKIKAIRNFGLRSTIFTLYSFIELRKTGVLTKGVYKKYKKKWVMYSGKPLIIFFLCTIAPVGILIFCRNLKTLSVKYIRDFNYFMRSLSAKNRLKTFCNKYDSIYIYGAGKVAACYIGYLKEMKINLQGLVVTDASKQNQKSIDGIPILSYDMLQNREDTGIILGLNWKNANEIKLYLYMKKFKGGVFDEYIRK
jgi:hypothetical protein